MKAKALGVFEVSVVFILMSYLFRYVQSKPLPRGIPDSLDAFIFLGYAVLSFLELMVLPNSSQRLTVRLPPRLRTKQLLRKYI